MGIAAPLVFTGLGFYSVVTQHSYFLLRRSGFVPIHGEQAILMGIALYGIALMLFGHCYAQYHEKMAYYYQWILGLGAFLTGGGYLWCFFLFIFG